MKQFDCQKMPKNIKNALFDIAPEEWNNGGYYEWEVEEDGDEDINKINSWLVSKGCKIGQTVLIKFWW